MKKATNNSSQSVVYSFEGRWESLIRAGKVGVFFRKRRPVKQPKYIFFYVGVPVKSIIGYASVETIREVDLAEASDLKEFGSISDKELSLYIAQGRVHAIFIGKPVIFEIPKDLASLRETCGFNPPQSFSIVDPVLGAELIVDEK